MSKKKSEPSRKPANKSAPPVKPQNPMALQDHNHPVSLKDFDRERMGIAAKE